MFSPGTKRSKLAARNDPTTPITPPLPPHRNQITDSSPIPNRPSTGTPAPWASRLSVLARISPGKKSDKDDEDPNKPIYVGEFPEVVRNEQANLMHKQLHGDAFNSGGIDKATSLAWIICGSKIFIWQYLPSAKSRKCVVLDIPLTVADVGGSSINSRHGNNWSLCIMTRDSTSKRTSKALNQYSSVGVISCNLKTRAVVYWDDIYSEVSNSPVTSIDNLEETFSSGQQKTGSNSYNSFIASAASYPSNVCLALACSSSGEIWQFICSPNGIERKLAIHDVLELSFQGSDVNQVNRSKGYPRSLTWHFANHSLEESERQFLLLTDHELQCFTVKLNNSYEVSKRWSHEIISPDGDLGIKKGLAGQKRIWPLDLQLDNSGKIITVLIATFCKDRITSSSFIEYSLLTMQYKSGPRISAECIEQTDEKVLEKKAPLQVIIPKARVEDEDFLFLMRLKVGGKPSGSAIILSGDGTATVSHYWRDSTRLYQFDLPYDAGKVLDASILPSDDADDGPWVVLTQKAGLWAIPEKAVLLGGVEPPERSLSRKGSSNEGSAQVERRNFPFSGNIVPRRASSEAWDAGDKQKAVFTGITHRTAQDEESEALLNILFNDFLLSGQVTGAFDKLNSSRAFERDGETSVFTRLSKSIVDTLAKHWTTTRGAEIVALSVVSHQLVDKQQKHQKFLQFLALSKCHEELCSKQRQSLQFIMEHGEKLSAVIKLKELQNNISNHSSGLGGSYSTIDSKISGPLWDLIQLVGEKLRRNTVLLMDRDNAEVFYSKVSELEEVFICLDRHLEYIITEEMQLPIQFQRACELSNACVLLVRTALHYRNEHHVWYPSPEGLTPWYCRIVVRSGLRRIASFMLQISNESNRLDRPKRLEFYSNLEVLAEVLLEAYSGAITAKSELKEDNTGLLNEYWNRRDTLFTALYQQAKSFVEPIYQDLSEGDEEQGEEIFRNLSSRLLSIANRHEGYQTLWTICCDLNDSDLLRSFMHESMGPKGGFSYYVFQQLYNNKQFAKLIKLGEEFPEELLTFLKLHNDLLWLHQLFVHQFSAASETLHKLAFSQNSGFISESEVLESHHPIIEPTLADRKRFLNLSKIAALAGKTADYDKKLKRIEADLKLLKLQEETLKLLPENEETRKIGERILPSLELIQLCLGSQHRELSILAFDVFACSTSSFIKSNASLLEECWRNAANQDEWGKIYQTSMIEGWSEEETHGYLKETVLFQASHRCYGPNAASLEGGFEEVLPLRQENTNHLSLKETGSVEAILMQHKDFPEAGKLMLTAIMLGTVQADSTVEGSPSPMEA